MQETKNAYYINPNNNFKFKGFLDEAIRFIENNQLKDKSLWKRFVEQYELHSDNDNGWRGEYWGKMMRGACCVYSCTKDAELYEILTESVEDLLSVADSDGCIRSYPKENEFGSWDLWCRKYVMLGLLYYYDICTDTSFKTKIIECLKIQADCIAEFFENGKGGKCITEFGAYRGINSSSILEPFVWIYEITGEDKYLEFSKYIVECGGTSVGNIFELAYENELPPYQYPITKAYEMISCFEGLLRLYILEHDERHKRMLINFANAVLETDFTILGGSSCSHEFFDHSTVRQTNPGYGKSMQETCVTVTLMKFLLRMVETFGDCKYVDAFECSMYNAYLGSLNTNLNTNDKILAKFPDAIIEPLPFDSYSPLASGVRGVGIGGLRIMPDNHYYGCCACIGSVGIGMYHKMMCMNFYNGVAINLYNSGVIEAFTPDGNTLLLSFDTKYPKDGNVKITLSHCKDEMFSIRLRNPNWSRHTVVNINGVKQVLGDGYNDINRTWKNGDIIELEFDMNFYIIRPTPYGKDLLFTKVYGGEKDYTSHFVDHEDETAKNRIAVKRGPLIMAVDSRLGRDVTKPIPLKCDTETIPGEISDDNVAPYDNIIEVKLQAEDGPFYMTDYASAGKDWNDESAIAAWFLTN